MVVSGIRLALALVASLCLLAMMGLTVCDVIGRYMMNAPIPGASEVTELLLAAVVFLGLPAACLDREQIDIDLVTNRLPDAVRTALARAVAVASALILGVVAWRLWKMGDQIGSYSGATPTLKIPIAPLAYSVGLLCAFAALITLTQAWAGAKRNG